MAGVSSVLTATDRPQSAVCQVGFGWNWALLWLLYCYKIDNDIAPKLYHNFADRVKQNHRRLSTLSRRPSVSFCNGINGITVPDSIN